MRITAYKFKKHKIIAAVLAVIILTMTGCDKIKNLQSSVFDKILVDTASQINNTLPMMIDSETRFDSTAAYPGKEFAYFFTIINYTVEEVDMDIFEGIRANLINNAKTNSDMEIFRENKVNLKYVYRDKDMKEIIQIKISADEYI